MKSQNARWDDIPHWVGLFALDSRYEPAGVWAAVQKFGEEKAKDAHSKGMLYIYREHHSCGDVCVGAHKACPRCKRPL